MNVSVYSSNNFFSFGMERFLKEYFEPELDILPTNDINKLNNLNSDIIIVEINSYSDYMFLYDSCAKRKGVIICFLQHQKTNSIMNYFHENILWINKSADPISMHERLQKVIALSQKGMLPYEIFDIMSATKLTPITESELLILRGIANGLSAKLLSGIFNVDSKTIHAHLTNVKKKFNIKGKNNLSIFMSPNIGWSAIT
jgi:ATP-dependent transcriptional regulator